MEKASTIDHNPNFHQIITSIYPLKSEALKEYDTVMSFT